MIEIEPLQKIIALTLQSSYVKNSEKAVSLLIIAGHERGKTEALAEATQELIKSKRIFWSNNLTSKYIERSLLPDIKEGRIRHLVIPDILNAIERGKSTRKLFINFMKSLIEEGIIHLADAYGAFASDVPVKCGLITCITKNNLKENFIEWRNIGFLSRLIPFSYEYDLAKINKILDMFMTEENDADFPFKIKCTDKVIADMPDYTTFKVIAMTFSRGLEGIGTRMQKLLISLARSNAYLRGDTKVTQEDINEILRLTKWMNFDYNPL